MERRKSVFFENGFWWWWDASIKDYRVGPAPAIGAPVWADPKWWKNR